MQTQRLREDARVLSAQALSRQNTSRPQPQDIAAVLTEWQDITARETALELIEMRYQDNLAHMDLQALFAEEGLCCL